MSVIAMQKSSQHPAALPVFRREETVLAATLLLLMIYSSLLVSCGAITNYDITITSSFVDIYDTAAYSLQPVTATSDGGAAFAYYNSATHNIRVVKVSSGSAFEWFSEQRLTVGDDSSYKYYPVSIVDDASDVTSPYLFLAGYISYGTYNYAYIVKFKRGDGACVSSAKYEKVGFTTTFIQNLLLDSDGKLLLCGDYASGSAAYYGWFGVVDKSTLAVAEYSVTTTCSSTYYYIYKLAEDQLAGTYVFAGGCSSYNHLWVGTLSKSNRHIVVGNLARVCIE